MQDKMKRKADKLTKQSFALLDRIKQRKQKQTAPPSNNQNYIEDLYFKIFAKCSPHFNKAQISNDIYHHLRQKEKQTNRIRSQFDQLNKECCSLRLQVLKLKENKDQVGRIKILNQEITMLEQKVRGLVEEVRNGRKEKDILAEVNEHLKKENFGLKNSNAELEELVDKLSKELEAYLNVSMREQTPNCQMEQTVTKIKLLQREIEISNQQNDSLKSRLSHIEKVGDSKQAKLKKNQQKLISQIENLKRELQSTHRQTSKSKLMIKKIQDEQLQSNIIENQLQSAKAQMQKANIQLINADKRVQTTKRQLDNTRAQLERTRKQLQNIKTELMHTKKQLQIIKQQSEDAKRSYQNQKRQCQLIKRQMENTKRELQSTKKQSQGLTKQLQITKAQFEKTLKRHNDITTDKQKLQTQKNKELSTHQIQLKKLKDTIVLLTSRSDRQAKLNTDKQRKYDDLKREYQSNINQFRSQLNQFQSEKTKLKSETTTHKLQITKLTTQIQDLKTKIQSYESRCYEQETIINALRAQLNSTLSNSQTEKKKLIQKGIEQKALSLELIQKNKLIENKCQQINQLKSQVLSIKGQLQKSTGSSNEFSNRFINISNELQIVKNQKQRLQYDWNQEKNDMQSKIDELTERMKFFKTSNQQLNNQKIDMINSIQILAQQTKDINDQLEKLKENQQIQSKTKEIQQKKLLLEKHQIQKQIKILLQQNTRLNEQLELMKKQIELLSLQLKNSNLQQQLLLQIPDKVQHLQSDKSRKHIETINQLNNQLTQAYKTINQLSNKLKSNRQKQTITMKKSPEPKQRGNSIKKIAGIFGFKS